MKVKKALFLKVFLVIIFSVFLSTLLLGSITSVLSQDLSQNGLRSAELILPDLIKKMKKVIQNLVINSQNYLKAKPGKVKIELLEAELLKIGLFETSTICTCNYYAGICEAVCEGCKSPCKCDPDCSEGKKACQTDGHCDTWCETYIVEQHFKPDGYISGDVYAYSIDEDCVSRLMRSAQRGFSVTTQPLNEKSKLLWDSGYSRYSGNKGYNSFKYNNSMGKNPFTTPNPYLQQLDRNLSNSHQRTLNIIEYRNNKYYR